MIIVHKSGWAQRMLKQVIPNFPRIRIVKPADAAERPVEGDRQDSGTEAPSGSIEAHDGQK